MKKFFLSLAVFVMALCANAQTNQYFWYNGNLMMGNPIAQIDSVTFGEGEPADTLHILLPRTIIKEVHDTVYITIHDTICPNDIPEGALAGEFSVSATKKVRFSKGNLQFNAAQGTHQCADGTTKQGTWRFAENQYDIIGQANANASSTYDGWIDVFSWGTSGWNSGANIYQPWEMSSWYGDCYVGGSASNNLTGSYVFADWGVYNAISNGSDIPDKWRTLTKDEVEYLFNSRQRASELYSCATVNGVQGLLILPDNWTSPVGFSFVPGVTLQYSTNNYTLADWNKISNEAIFLPKSGVRVHGSGWVNSGDEENGREGNYWTSTSAGSIACYYISFSDVWFDVVHSWNYRSDGMSVRLVQDIE